MNKSLPYGLQVLKRLWDDNSALIHEYDEFAENSDNQAVKFYCSSECAQKRKTGVAAPHKLPWSSHAVTSRGLSS